MANSAPPLSDQIEWSLTLDDGTNALKVIPVTGDSLLLGRAFSADIRLDDGVISRHHARITRRDNQLIIEDLDTVNGTLVNGERLTRPRLLEANDVIELGRFTLKVERGNNLAQGGTVAAKATSSASTKWMIMLAAGIFGLIMIALLGTGSYLYFYRNQATGKETPNPGSSSDAPTIILGQVPANNSVVPLNQMVLVHARATAPKGVIRLELWVNGRKVDELDPQLTQPASSMDATLRWVPNAAGVYALQVRAYNQDGQASIQAIGSVKAAGETAPPTPAAIMPIPTISLLTPLDTPSPILPSPTPTLLLLVPTPNPTLLTITAPTISMHTGPGEQYDLIGQLVQGSQFQIVGQVYVGSSRWWQISYDVAMGSLGWVLADPGQVATINDESIPAVIPPPTPTQAAVAIKTTPSSPSSPVAVAGTMAPSTSTLTPTIIPVVTPAPVGNEAVLRAPAGQTLVIVGNRSLTNQPALLTLSGGKSVGGGREIKVSPGEEAQVVLEPDFYRALWSSTARGGFARGSDFTAPPSKIMVMWIVPEEGRTETELYDQLAAAAEVTAVPSTVTPAPVMTGYSAPLGKALFVAANRSLNNSYGMVTLSGGSLGGGKEVKLDAGAEIPLELLPGKYRAMWSSPARREGFTAGRDFSVTAGEVILTWLIPEEGQVFMQFPGQEPLQINN